MWSFPSLLAPSTAGALAAVMGSPEGEEGQVDGEEEGRDIIIDRSQLQWKEFCTVAMEICKVHV